MEVKTVDLFVIDSSGFALRDLEATGLAALGAEERARYERLHLERSRRQLLLSRAALRSVLALSHPAEQSLMFNAHGRPELRGAPGFSFNLSHSRDRLVIATSRAGIVGVDVEFAGRERRVEQLITRYFSRDEQAALLALPAASRLARFYALWALKEAYIKARGLGLAIPLGDFSFELGDAGIGIRFERSLAEQRPQDWRFWSQRVAGAEYAFGLALEGAGEGQVELIVRHSNAALGLERWAAPQTLA